MEKAFNVARKVGMIWFYLALILVGAFLAVCGFWAMSTPQPDTNQAEAVITYAKLGYYDNITEMQEDYLFKVTYTDQEGVEHVDVELNGYSSEYYKGKIITIEYDPNDPEGMVSEAGGDIVLYVVTGVGVIAVIAGIICLVKCFAKKTDDMNEFDKVDIQQVSEEQIAKIKESTAPTNNYYFRFCGHLNQSYVMETHERQAVYQANCEKIQLFQPTNYDFVDARSGNTQLHKIGHTLTNRMGTGNGNSSFSIPTSSAFKIDDVNCWIYFGKLGYSLERHFTGLAFDFDVLHYGIKVAHIKTAGSNILPQRENKQCAIGKLPTNGLYEIECRDEDIEACFWACFIASRVEFF